MIVIECPVCGPRESNEFAYWGEVNAAFDPGQDIAAYRRQLYLRSNEDAWARERWLHVAGCGRFLELERHRTTNRTRPIAGQASAAPPA
jgi:heterotetrameric sarcosine oxidase delta subunit